MHTFDLPVCRHDFENTISYGCFTLPVALSQLFVTREHFVWSEGTISWRVDWRSVRMRHGGLSVMMDGLTMAPM